MRETPLMRSSWSAATGQIKPTQMTSEGQLCRRACRSLARGGEKDPQTREPIMAITLRVLLSLPSPVFHRRRWPDRGDTFRFVAIQDLPRNIGNGKVESEVAVQHPK